MIILKAIPPKDEQIGIVPLMPYDLHVNHYHIVAFNRSISGEERTVLYTTMGVFDVQEKPEEIIRKIRLAKKNR